MKVRVGVMFGGCSVEHEVSIITALQAMDRMDTSKYEIVPIYITKDRVWYTGNMLRDMDMYSDLDLLKRYGREVVLYNKGGHFVLQNKKGLFKREVGEIDIAFPIMHGTTGEDGSLQGYLETINIPFAESGVYASVVGQDKVFMKQIFNDCGVNIVKYRWFFDTDFSNDPEKILNSIEKLGYPVIVKPATLGSSVGIKPCHNLGELRSAIEEAMEYDNKIIVEEMIADLLEVNISVLGNYEKQSLSVIEEVGGSNEFLTYEDKYIGSGKVKGKNGIKVPLKSARKGIVNTKRIIPANISDKLAKDVREMAIKAFRAMNSSGVVRIDFLINRKEDKVYVNEINSIPGSLSFYLWEKTDRDYSDLLDDIITIAIRDFKKRNSKTRTFDTNILANFNGLKGAKGLKGMKR